MTWGLVSAAMMFAHTETTFYVLRLLLGVAEAGFFPGVILYLTYWFPGPAARQGDWAFSTSARRSPSSSAAPCRACLLEMDGVRGLQGWQWMFLVEGLLASVVGVWAYLYLDDKPADARGSPSRGEAALSAAVSSRGAAQTRSRPHERARGALQPARALSQRRSIS